MSTPDPVAEMKGVLAAADVAVGEVEPRSFPGENWLIAYVPESALTAAQSLAGSIERTLNEKFPDETASYVVTFRPQRVAIEEEEKPTDGSRLARKEITQLIQLLEARSRTSDALPSLSYVEDPRASLAAVAASRHHLIYGRRGVGKTALLLEAKRIAEREGHVAAWINAQTLRQLDAATAFAEIADAVLEALLRQAGSSQSAVFARLSKAKSSFEKLLEKRPVSDIAIANAMAKLNLALRSILKPGIIRLNLFIDDFYLLPVSVQPQLLDYTSSMLRDTDGWIKVASIERLTRPFEPSTKIGLEIPHDASRIDLDLTLENPGAAQDFLESVLSKYTSTAGIKQLSSIAKPEALGRLTIASGGVPRDYLNLFASSIVAARGRNKAREIGREDVARAASESSQSKKRDLEQDVSSDISGALLIALERLSNTVKSEGYAYFRVDMADKDRPGYELLAQLVDMRFTHLIQATLSDQRKAGKKYEAYMLALSEFADVRLRRSLEILDLESGSWVARLTGTRGSKQRLVGTQLRDKLRRAPLVSVDDLIADN